MSEQLGAAPSFAVTRRRLLAACSAAGLGHTLVPGALLALASQGAEAQRAVGTTVTTGPEVTPEMIDVVAKMTGIAITDEQKKMMIAGIKSQHEAVVTVRELKLPNAVAPSLQFNPVPGGMVLDTVKKPMKTSAAPKVTYDASAGVESLAFLTVRELAELVRTRKVTSV